jgi:hypothetical protein
MREPYQGHVIAEAFRGMGFHIDPSPRNSPSRGDVLVLWNRYARDERFAQAYEAAGAKVFILENGYLGREGLPGGPHYALSVGQHNGMGILNRPNLDRFASLGIPLLPWREPGREVVVLATRGMGSNVTREPNGWAAKVCRTFASSTGMPARIRAHPGPLGAPGYATLEDDLRDAAFAVTWGSTAGLKALAYGVPVYYGLSGWVGALGGRHVSARQSPPLRNDYHREVAFAVVGGGIVNLSELRDGSAFSWAL